MPAPTPDFIDVIDAGVATQSVPTLQHLGLKTDAAWDGAAASPTGISIWKYIGVKIEAVRASFAVFGTTADPKNTATDATPVSVIGVLKQISASVQGFITALGSPGPQTAANSSSVTPANTSDVTASRVHSAATTNATSLKASAGVVRSIDLFNNAAYAVFVKFYNKATAPAVGTDVPLWTIPLPAGSGYSKQYFVGLPFSTGIAYAITKVQADADTTAIAADDVTGIINWV
jgi:hypothetical protein